MDPMPKPIKRQNQPASQILKEADKHEKLERFLRKQEKLEDTETNSKMSAFVKQNQFLQSSAQLSDLRTIYTPVDQFTHIQSVVLPSQPEFHMTVSFVKYNVHQKGHTPKYQTVDTHELKRENLAEFINMNKTHNHREYEAYCVNEGLVGQGIVTKTADLQSRFEKDSFFIFQVYEGDLLVNEWVLYDWFLESYFENSQEMIRQSLEKSQNQKKLYFYARKDGNLLLFILKESQLIQKQQTPTSANPLQLEKIATQIKINNLDPKCCNLLEIVGETIVWGLKNHNLVLAQQLQAGSNQKRYYHTAQQEFGIILNENQWGESIALLSETETQIVAFTEFSSQTEILELETNRCYSRFYANNSMISLSKKKKNFEFTIIKNSKKQSVNYKTSLWVDWMQIGDKVFVSGSISKSSTQQLKISLWEFSHNSVDQIHQFLHESWFVQELSQQSFYLSSLYDVNLDSFCITPQCLKSDILYCVLKFIYNRTKQIVVANSSIHGKIKNIQINRHEQAIVQYPALISTVPLLNNAVRIVLSDINYKQIQLLFPNHKVLFIAENQADPLSVILLLECQKEPNKLQIANIEVRLCQDALENIKTGQTGCYQQLADLLNDLSESSVAYEIKQVQFYKAFERQSINSPIIQFVKFTQGDQSCYYIQTQENLLFLDSDCNQVSKMLTDVQRLLQPITSSVSNYCLCELQNGYQSIRRLTLDSSELVLQISPGQKVLMIQAIQSSCFQYLCSDNSIYDDKNNKIYQCGEMNTFVQFFWGERSIMYLEDGKIFCFVYQTKQELDVTSQMVPPECYVFALLQIKGTNKFQVLFSQHGVTYSCIRQQIDSAQLMFVSPDLISKLSKGYGISNTSFYRNKCLIQINKNCLIFDWMTSSLLHYFQIPHGTSKIIIQQNILEVGDVKFHLNQIQSEEFKTNEQTNTLFFDDQYICFIVQNEESEQNFKEGLTLKRTSITKRFKISIGKDFESGPQVFLNTGKFIVWHSNSSKKVFCVEIISLFKKLEKQAKKSLEIKGKKLVKEINLFDFQDNYEIYSIQPVSQAFINQISNDCVESIKKRQTTEVIQILFGEFALIWDLVTHQQIKAIKRNKSQQKNSFCSEEFMTSNQDYSLVVKQDGVASDDTKICIFYSDLDLILTQACLKEKDLSNFDLQSLVSKIYGQTFFSLTNDEMYDSLIEKIKDYLVNQSSSIFVNDTDYFEKLASTLLLNLEFDQKSNTFITSDPLIDYISIYYDPTGKNVKNEQLSRNKRTPVRKSIIQHALHDQDKRKFLALLTLLLQSKQARHSNIINTRQHINEILSIKDKTVKQYLTQGIVYSKETAKLLTLQVTGTDEDNIVCFSSNTTLLSEVAIRKRFAEVIKVSKGFLGLLHQLFGYKLTDFLTNFIINRVHQLKAKITGSEYQEQKLIVRSYTVKIIDIGWLKNGIIPFLRNAEQNRDNYDVELIRILLDQIAYPWSLYVFLFWPYLIYCGILSYYYSFCLTQAQNGPGVSFIEGDTDAIVLRFFVLGLTAYFFVVEIIQAMTDIRTYVLGFFGNLIYLSMLALNLWIINEHATSSANCDPITLSHVASAVTVLLWFYLFNWFKIFDQYALYVELLIKIVIDTRHYMVMLLLILLGFGFATLVLDREMVQQPQEFDENGDPVGVSYVSLVDQYFGYYTTDLFFGQYQVGIFMGNTSNYNQNPGKDLLWIYYFCQTFLIQINFYYLLYSVMAHTYEEEFSEPVRNVVIMRSVIYSQYAGFLNLIEKQIPQKFNQRYLYVAVHKTQEETEEAEQMIGEISNIVQENFARIETTIGKQVKELQTELKKIAKEQDTKMLEIATRQDAKMEQILKLFQENAAKK